MDGIAESWRRLKARAGAAGPAENDEETAVDIAQVLHALNLKNVSTLKDVATEGLTKQPMDDKTYLMERIIQMAAELPTGSVTSQTLTHTFLTQLWDDLEHPPTSYLGNDYVFRKADGSNNNFLWPHIGAANQPYARSIKPNRIRPVARPDPDVLFDSLLKRKRFEPHPNKISSVLFYVASIIIHDIFHTSHHDMTKSETSSYLDLAPLYGSNDEAQQRVRTKENGMLKPDCFADERILGFPPGVGVLLLMFNRFHNNVVQKIAQIDENGRFSRILDPPRGARTKQTVDAYDEALFQTGRLITTGLYINIILKDYVRTILNLNRVDSNWNLDPRSQEGKAVFGKKIPEASGNQVSAEFNMVYRWHSCVSERDEKWTKAVYDRIFPGSNKNSTMEDFLRALTKWAMDMPKEPEKRNFNDLKRDSTGRFADDDLASIWTDSVNDVAGAFGANHVPEVLRNIEVLGIIQARTWNLASLNEFRKYFKLKPWEKFEDMNPDPAVAEQLRRLYEHPDNVELYPGIIVEAAKEPKKPGSGLCTNYTVSRAILSDAVALVRGDRFYTVDYTTSNLTNYGYSLANYDTHINHGCVFYKLVLSALPNNYAPNSIYAHYPLVVPAENQKILTEMKRGQLYNFSAPISLPKAVALTSFEACKAVFQSAARTAALPDIPLPSDFQVAKGQTKSVSGSLDSLRKYLAATPSPTYIQQFFEKVSSTLLKRATYQIASINQVDVIRDVANLAQVHFAACLFGLPLKTEDNPRGHFEAADLWAALTAIYSSIHPRQNSADSFYARQTGRLAVQQLGSLIEKNINSVDPKQHGMLDSLLDMLHTHDSGDLTDQSTHLIQSMLHLGLSAQQITYSYILPVAATIVVTQARAFADCLDFLLDAGKEHLATVQRLAQQNTKEADIQIEQYVLEATRLASKLKVYAQVTSSMTVQNVEGETRIPADGLAQCDLAAANKDAKVFTNPDKFDNKREISSYLPGLPGFPPSFPGASLGRPAVVGLLKTVVRLPGLQRARGPVGRMKKMKASDGSELYMTRNETASHTYPSSMQINFE